MNAVRSAWDRYHRGKLLVWGGFVLYLPVMVVVHLVLDAAGAPDDAAAWCAAAWLGAWMLCGGWLGRFLCPRCGQRFFYINRFSANLFATRCCQCGERPRAA